VTVTEQAAVFAGEQQCAKQRMMRFESSPKLLFTQRLTLLQEW